jgi:hypothetical protein
LRGRLHVLYGLLSADRRWGNEKKRGRSEGKMHVRTKFQATHRNKLSDSNFFVYCDTGRL